MRVLLLVGVAAWIQMAQPVMAQELSPVGSDEQRDAMSDLAFLDGEWRGEAVVMTPDGSMRTLTQTERVGTLLGGSIRLVEGRGYDADGETVFNAFAVISWDDATDQYRFHTWANGRHGEFDLQATEDGFVWEIPAGPGAVVRYETVIAHGVWRETGDYIREGAEPVRTIEMTLTRIGDSDWPGAGAVDRR